MVDGDRAADGASRHPPMIMPPQLEEWVRHRLGDGMFRELRDRPLVAVTLAAERMVKAGERVPDDVLLSWVVFLAAKRDELTRSERFLATLVDDREDVREFARTRLGAVSNGMSGNVGGGRRS